MYPTININSLEEFKNASQVNHAIIFGEDEALDCHCFG